MPGLLGKNTSSGFWQGSMVKWFGWAVWSLRGSECFTQPQNRIFFFNLLVSIVVLQVYYVVQVANKKITPSAGRNQGQTKQ